MSWLFTSGSQSIGASVSASVLPMNIGVLRVNTHQEKTSQRSSEKSIEQQSVHFSSVAQSCPTLRPPHHHLPEFTQTHVHRAHDAIQPSHHTPAKPESEQEHQKKQKKQPSCRKRAGVTCPPSSVFPVFLCAGLTAKMARDLGVGPAMRGLAWSLAPKHLALYPLKSTT